MVFMSTAARKPHLATACYFRLYSSVMSTHRALLLHQVGGEGRCTVCKKHKKPKQCQGTAASPGNSSVHAPACDLIPLQIGQLRMVI